MAQLAIESTLAALLGRGMDFLGLLEVLIEGPAND